MDAKSPLLLSPATDEVVLPVGFARARELFCAALEDCTFEQLPSHSVLAAMTTELVPRLLALYGPLGASHILETLAKSALADRSTCSQQ